MSNNLLILPSKKSDKKISQKEQPKIYKKPEIQIKKQFDPLSISSISINVDGKDFTISKDDSKDVTKDFTKDHTREISKDTSREPKNTTFDDDVVNYKDIQKPKKSEKKEDKEKASFNKGDEEKNISKDKSMDKDLMESSPGFTLDEPVKLPIQQEEPKDMTFEKEEPKDMTFEKEEGKDMTFEEPKDKDTTFDKEIPDKELSLPRKFNKFLLGDFLPKAPKHILMDSAVDRASFMPHDSTSIPIKNKDIVISSYSFELLKETNPFTSYEESKIETGNDLITLPVMTYMNEEDNNHILTDSIFTHNFFKKDKSRPREDKGRLSINIPETSSDKSPNSQNATPNSQGKTMLLKSILPIKTLKIMKDNNKKNIFEDLMNSIRKKAQKNEIEKIDKINGNKILKKYLDKWKLHILAMKIREQIMNELKPEDKEIKPEDKEIKPEDKEIKPEDKEIKPEDKEIKPEDKE